MNYFTTRHVSGPEAKEPRRCIRCSAEPKLVGTMLDSNKGRIIRMFKCHCGEQTWVSDPARIAGQVAAHGQTLHAQGKGRDHGWRRHGPGHGRMDDHARHCIDVHSVEVKAASGGLSDV